MLKARTERENQALEQTRLLNHELAGLILCAFHAPKKMPEYRPLAEASQAGPTPASQERARGAFIAWALQSQKGRQRGPTPKTKIKDTQ